MWLTTRLQTLETRLRPADEPPELRIVLVDAEGCWWEHDQEIDPDTIDPRMRVCLLRQLVTDPPRCA